MCVCACACVSVNHICVYKVDPTRLLAVQISSENSIRCVLLDVSRLMQLKLRKEKKRKQFFSNWSLSIASHAGLMMEIQTTVRVLFVSVCASQVNSTCVMFLFSLRLSQDIK
jgi:hypothetical protein